MTGVWRIQVSDIVSQHSLWVRSFWIVWGHFCHYLCPCGAGWFYSYPRLEEHLKNLAVLWRLWLRSDVWLAFWLKSHTRADHHLDCCSVTCEAKSPWYHVACMLWDCMNLQVLVHLGTRKVCFCQCVQVRCILLSRTSLLQLLCMWVRLRVVQRYHWWFPIYKQTSIYTIYTVG